MTTNFDILIKEYDNNDIEIKYYQDLIKTTKDEYVVEMYQYKIKKIQNQQKIIEKRINK